LIILIFAYPKEAFADFHFIKVVKCKTRSSTHTLFPLLCLTFRLCAVASVNYNWVGKHDFKFTIIFLYRSLILRQLRMNLC